jgi:hypothetical protein
MIFLKQITYLSSSHNFTQLKKSNCPNRSFGSEDIADLKSTIFGEVFMTTDGTTKFINFHRVLRLLPDKYHWINHFKIFLLIYYMWCFRWIFVLKSWQPSIQQFKS